MGHIVAGCRQEVTCKLTTMTGMLSTQTRTRVQMSGRNFRKVPEMLSTIAFCRLSIADSLMVAESTATTTMIHTCAAAAIS